MPRSDLVDPQLRAALEFFSAQDMGPVALPASRQLRETLMADPATAQAVADADERWIPGRDGAPDIRVLIYGTDNPGSALRPALLHIHGGGYVIGCPEMNAVSMKEIAEQFDCIVVSVDYRLAPETPYPGPVEDCYAALAWLHGEADSLGVDRGRIGVSGESAGGGLAAGLVLLARDRGELPLKFQHLIFPMIDDRTCTTSDPHPNTGEYVWTPTSNLFGWTSLLGKAPGGDDVEIYAAAARAQDLSGLPPTYIAVGALDLFLDENMDYAMRLSRQGVPIELHVYPGAYHGFQMSADADVTRQANRDSMKAIQRLFSA